MEHVGCHRELKRSADNHNSNTHVPIRMKSKGVMHHNLSPFELLPEELKWMIIDFALESVDVLRMVSEKKTTKF